MLQRVASGGQPGEGTPCLEGPVRCLLVRDNRVWAAGGRAEPWLALFNATTGMQSMATNSYMRAFVCHLLME